MFSKSIATKHCAILRLDNFTSPCDLLWLSMSSERRLIRESSSSTAYFRSKVGGDRGNCLDTNFTMTIVVDSGFRWSKKFHSAL